VWVLVVSLAMYRRPAGSRLVLRAAEQEAT